MFFPFTNYKKVVTNTTSASQGVIYTTTARSMIVVEFTPTSEVYSFPPEIYVDESFDGRYLFTSTASTSPITDILSYPSVISASRDIAYSGAKGFAPFNENIILHIFELPE